MKIVNQTSDELVLKEGDASGIIFGTLLLLVGIGLGFYLSSSNSVVIWIALALGITKQTASLYIKRSALLEDR
jgi:hypothetical protein